MIKKVKTIGTPAELKKLLRKHDCVSELLGSYGLPQGDGTGIDIKSLVLESSRNPICPHWFLPEIKALCEMYSYSNPMWNQS